MKQLLHFFKTTSVKWLLFFCVLFAVTQLPAQQKPVYTQYILNNYIINPAITGIENYTDVKISYRNQWTGIDGAPVTTYLSIQGQVGKKDYRTSATSYDVPGENPRGRSYRESYTAAEPHHGLGGIRHLIWDTGRGFDTVTIEWMARANLAGSTVLTILLWIIAYGVMA